MGHKHCLVEKKSWSVKKSWYCYKTCRKNMSHSQILASFNQLLFTDKVSHVHTLPLLSYTCLLKRKSINKGYYDNQCQRNGDPRFHQ